jgi:hypothetical protein
MYSGTGVWAGQANWQSTTFKKYAGSRISVGCIRTQFLHYRDDVAMHCRLDGNAPVQTISAESIRLLCRMEPAEQKVPEKLQHVKIEEYV